MIISESTGWIAIFVTVLLAIIAFGFGYGVNTNRITQVEKRQDKCDDVLEKLENDYKQAIADLRLENREDHKLIFSKLDDIINRT